MASSAGPPSSAPNTLEFSAPLDLGSLVLEPGIRDVLAHFNTSWNARVDPVVSLSTCWDRLVTVFYAGSLAITKYNEAALIKPNSVDNIFKLVDTLHEHLRTLWFVYTHGRDEIVCLSGFLFNLRGKTHPMTPRITAKVQAGIDLVQQVQILCVRLSASNSALAERALLFHSQAASWSAHDRQEVQDSLQDVSAALRNADGYHDISFPREVVKPLQAITRARQIFPLVSNLHTKLVDMSERDHLAAERAVKEFHDGTHNLYGILSMDYDADVMDGRHGSLGIVASGRPRVAWTVDF